MSEKPSFTQIIAARNHQFTPQIMRVAEREKRDPQFILDRVASGRIVIPANINHHALDPMGIGRELMIKINANIGTSPISSDLEKELEKLAFAVKYGADTVMDLSTGSDIAAIRRAIIQKSSVPVGTVPIYETVARFGAENICRETILQVIAEQAEQGVDYMTIHAGLLAGHIDLALKRKLGIVSRGGSLIARHIKRNRCENPYYQYFDEILDICRRYDVTLSLGDGLRPGCLADASDAAQFAELDELGKLVRRCREAGVQAMVEGPGHVPYNEIKMNMERERERCDDAPFYILGPVVVDCAPGYDHITAAIGAAQGAFCGAAMLCYVTPMEHLGLPQSEDVRNGVIAFKIAAHAIDVARELPGVREVDDAISDARAAFDWEKQFSLALDPERARGFRKRAAGNCQNDSRYCTMCGKDFCSMRINAELTGK
ncbi:MAG: phosphomethylpyrimidine synthase ThiC [Lentisphaeria bacterium]|nr:phosphomethylpyrimidine synthase ThiC [Lentisphaeria bacterium]